MLKLADFFHLPHVDTLFERIIARGPGLTVVAGLGAPENAVQHGVSASGHTTLFRILMREILAAHPDLPCAIIAPDRDTIRVPREFRTRVNVRTLGIHDYPELIETTAQESSANLLVIDHLTPASTPAALAAAANGAWVLAQLDTALIGGEVVQQLLSHGADPDHLAGLAWIVAVQRMPTLCTRCKTPATLSAAQRAWITMELAALEEDSTQHPGIHQPAGCEHCQNSGYAGDVMVFDIFHPTATEPVTTCIRQPSQLPAAQYALQLATQGYLALDDVQDFQAARFRHLHELLLATEHQLTLQSRTMERKVAELETANRVLEQRTRALITLQDIVHTLTDNTGVEALIGRICRHACALCEADRAILYTRRSDGNAEILLAQGWPALKQGQIVEGARVFTPEVMRSAARFTQLPPGLPTVDNPRLLARGIAAPLRTQDDTTGLLLIHAGHSGSPFNPGNLALLQALADQAALAIQLERLVKTRTQQERLERELELARQVQQSVLPRHFPLIEGYTFAARNEPARQVGGDFYDVIALDDEHFGVAIADVSGKGIPAALFMALTRSVLRAKAYYNIDSPCAMITDLNQLLQELGQPNMFVTIFYGVLHRPTRRLTFTRAGHDRPVLLRAGTATELQGKGTALGLFGREDLKLSEEHIDLQSGDRLILYTDGLTDVANPAGELFERAQLLTMLTQYAALPPTDLCAAVYRDLTAYQGSAEQFDDMTMLAMAVE